MPTGALLLASLVCAPARAQKVGGAMLLPAASRPAVGAPVRKPTPEETRSMAQELERRLDVLHETLALQNAEFDRASLDLAGAAKWFERVPPDNPESEKLQEKLQRILEKYPKASLILEMTIAARRLQVYPEVRFSVKTALERLAAGRTRQQPRP